MRDLALLELQRRFQAPGLSIAQIRQSHGASLLPLLVEAGENIERVWLLQLDSIKGHVRLWVEELDEAKRRRLPFNKPTGSQSAAIGPVFKRSYARGKPPGPSPKINQTTIKHFISLGDENKPWSNYFSEMQEMLGGARPLHLLGQVESCRPGETTLDAAIRVLPETKGTVFLAAVDQHGTWPGDRPDYLSYLQNELAKLKYTTGQGPVHPDGVCPLCASKGDLYPNALKGAGLNLRNMDRSGAFPGLDTEDAWKGFSLCINCCDLLSFFKNHMINDFLTYISGRKSLVLPDLMGDPASRSAFVSDFHVYLQSLDGGALRSQESDLLDFLSERQDHQMVLHLLWAKFGQNVEEVQGRVTDILPSRLQTLSRLFAQFERWGHALAPAPPLAKLRLGLRLQGLSELFYRPGGKKVQSSNDSARLFELKRQVAACLYHGTPLGGLEARLWQELLETARAYLADSSDFFGLLQQTQTADKSPTLASWVRHVARLLAMLQQAGTLTGSETTKMDYQPKMPALQAYFQPGSGISDPERAFAFLLGVLYGKLLQVQGGRSVNVHANALTWLKRLHLSGRDLPELYVRIREKLLAYGTDASADVRALLAELGILGTKLGDRIDLDSTATCYFLLLGQSVAVEVLPSRKHEKEMVE